MTSFTGPVGLSAHRQRIQPYTEFLHSLGHQAEMPSHQSLDQVLQALRGLLHREIRRRGLRDTSPSVLGLVGYRRWWGSSPSLPMAERGEGDALEELAVDCYVYIFIDRLRSLMAQLKAKGNIDGLVQRNVRNFVHDRQKRNDPLGFRVFHIFRRAAEESIAERRLFVLDEHRRFYNDTLLGFTPDSKASDAATERIDLTPIVARWNDALLSELMTARGPRLGSVVQEFQVRLLALEGEGLRSFRCRDIIEPLKADARKRWATLWCHGAGSQLIGDEAQLPMAATSEIESDLDEREGFRTLSACIERRLEASGGQLRTRRHLLKLWDYLKKFAMSDVDDGRDGISWKLEEEDLPSHRELSRTLDIPRERFPDLLATIRRATQKCLNKTVPGSYPRGAWESPPCAVRRQVMKDRREELLQSTGQAYRHLQQDPAADGAPASIGPPLRAGKLYALEQGSDLGVEWLAIEEHREGGCWFMIPGDPHPWLGSSDWALESEALGPMTLRCGQGQWLDPKVFAEAVETATLTADELSALLRARQEMGEGADRDMMRLDVDEDPEYQAWCRELEELCEALRCPTLSEESSQAPPDDAPVSTSDADETSEDATSREAPSGGPWRRPGDGFLSRAAMILLALGMAHWSGRWVEDRGAGTIRATIGQRQAQLERDVVSLQAQKQEVVGQLQGLMAGVFSGHSVLALIDDGTVRSGAEEVRLPKAATWVHLLMELPPLQTEDRLEIVRRSDGEIIWQNDQVGIADGEEKNVQVVPAVVLPDGIYELKVVREGEAGLQPIFARDLQVVRFE